MVEIGQFSGSTPPSTTATPTLGKTTTAYDAECTTVTDPAGKTRRSRLDGLGRLVRVDDPDSSDTLGSTGSPKQATSYSYNALDNLTRVTQGAQTRTFAYDSLSRLTSASNSESGTIAYTYNNGNPTGKTDARGVAGSNADDGAGRAGGVKRGEDWYAGGEGSDAVGYEPHEGVRQLLLATGCGSSGAITSGCSRSGSVRGRPRQRAA